MIPQDSDTGLENNFTTTIFQEAPQMEINKVKKIWNLHTID